jgi:hypothetical protein
VFAPSMRQRAGARLSTTFQFIVAVPWDPETARATTTCPPVIGATGRRAAVKGHTFGLNLSQDDRAALPAFLKTL